MRVILLQVRDDPAPRDQERLCFLETTGLQPEELECLNLVETPRIVWRQIRHADALLIGGAGTHTATDDYPFTRHLTDLLLRWLDEDRPFFGSCWGHHFLAEALGGSVVTDHASGEVGTFEVTLTPAGQQDPLFAGFPSRFPAQLGHHDRISQLAPGMAELAYSSRCRHQVVRLTGKPAYGTQFHSEMNASHLEARLMMYRDTYLAERTRPGELSSRLRPSPEVEGLLRRFLELHAGG